MLVRPGVGANQPVKIRLALEPLVGWELPLILAAGISASEARRTSDSAAEVAWWALVGAALYLMLVTVGTSVRTTELTVRIRRLSGFVRVVDLSDIRCVSARQAMVPAHGFIYLGQLVLKLQDGRSVRLFATTGAKQERVAALLDVFARCDFIEVDVDIGDFPRRVSGQRA